MKRITTFLTLALALIALPAAAQKVFVDFENYTFLHADNGI